MMMNYHLNNRPNGSRKKKLFLRGMIIVFIFLMGLYFLFPTTFQAMTLMVAKPIWNLKLTVMNSVGLGDYFSSKSSLIKENEELKEQMLKQNFSLLRFQAVEKENEELKSLLNRKQDNLETTAGRLLVTPPQSLYDTAIIDVGRNYDLEVGKKVFGHDFLFIGYVEEVFASTSKVKLITNPEEKTSVEIGNSGLRAEMFGAGGGNGVIELPKDAEVFTEDVVYLTGTDFVIGTIDHIESAETDSFKRLFVQSPISLQQIHWVQVEK